MKVFLSWSGSESKQLAGIFKEWLPNVLQYIEPYMSAKDISLGERWNNNITDSLEESVFGLIFVTPSNINAPWINFEAGALSKTFDSRVVPILYNADVMILNQGPLKQFQSAKNLDKENVLSLIKSINQGSGHFKLDEFRLEKAFEMWWPDLEKSIGAIEKEEAIESAEKEHEPTDRELLNVIYSKMIEQEKLVAKTQKNHQNFNDINVPQGIIRDLEKIRVILNECGNLLSEGPFPELLFENIEDGIIDLDRIIQFFNDKNHKKKLVFSTKL
ncbi:toll/interleukin-1 receptor domain-containing protein [Bacillus tropicus]|uniref:toll/interleukin-1 receptor domain-containing protein n=1 Tax=Bacillus cereus group TaxID=86661 RepID=UPI001D0EA71D|nr:toll/interleukin-1 receptor domain-containing protein [Bacillus tropicus]MCC2339122.1 toll/interleukin-1 receptor domain-containing protein [Bacillus tropicus]MCU5421754.1 toll/interleukin-1 receptor domain-containing protein [Bacillus tropicus]